MRYMLLLGVVVSSAGCCNKAIERAAEPLIQQNLLLQDQNDRLRHRVREQNRLLEEKDAQIRSLEETEG